jgi:ankyrin repeat protein
MEACKIDDDLGVEQLLKNGANPISQDFNGYDALYYCVTFSSLMCLKKLICMTYDKLPSNRTYGKKRRNILTIAAIYSHDVTIL